MRANATVTAVATATLLPLIFIHQSQAEPPGPPDQPVELSVNPERLEVTAGLPCIPAPPLTLGMTNTGDEAVYADSFLRADSPLSLSRGMFSSYLPAGTEVTVPVTIHAPHSAEPGEYEVALELAQELPPGGAKVRAPVEVTAPPEKTPGTNLLLGEQATPSSTFFSASQAFSECGAVDGDRTWSTGTAWNSFHPGEFPHTYTVTLPESEVMNRVDLYTSTPAADHGLRDWDVLVMTDGEWQTVAQVRGNTDRHVSSTFERIESTAVQIVGLASNDGNYSRIAELEAYNETVAVSLVADPPFVLFSGDQTELEATLTNLTDEQANGAVSLAVPQGWTVDPAEQAYQLDPGEEGLATFTVTSPAGAAAGDHEIVATLSPDGREATLDVQVRDGILYLHDGEPWYTETFVPGQGRFVGSSLPGHNGTPTRFSQNFEGGSGATATWTPPLPHAGSYRVYVWYPTNATTTTAASYTVTHADGADEIVVNQQENADTWNLLGTWEFDEGGSGSVTLTSAATGHHRANAVWFEPVDE